MYTRLLLSALCAALMVSPALAQSAKDKSELERAMKAVFRGPSVKKIKIKGHGFNVKKAKIERKGNTVTVSGSISHRLKWRPDDKVKYRIVKTGSEIKTFEVEFKAGGFKKIAKWVLRFLPEKYKKDLPIDPEKVIQAEEALLKLVGSGWKDAARLMVTCIAMRADEAGRDKVQLLRRKQASLRRSRARRSSRFPRAKRDPRAPRRPRSGAKR